MFPLQPLRDQLIVKEVEQNEKTDGGIFIPHTAAQENVAIGKVMAVGSGNILDSGERVPLEVEKGDSVLFERRSAAEFKYKGEKYMQLREMMVISKLVPEK